jgi:hypothetical protein
VLGQERFHFVQQRVAGEKIEETIAVAVSTVCLNSSMLMFFGSMAKLHRDRFLLVGCGFGDLHPTMVPVFLFDNQVLGLK